MSRRKKCLKEGLLGVGSLCESSFSSWVEVWVGVMLVGDVPV